MKKRFGGLEVVWVFHPIFVSNVVWHVLMRMTILYLFVLGMFPTQMRVIEALEQLALMSCDGRLVGAQNG